MYEQFFLEERVLAAAWLLGWLLLAPPSPVGTDRQY